MTPIKQVKSLSFVMEYDTLLNYFSTSESVNASENLLVWVYLTNGASLQLLIHSPGKTQE